MSDKENRQKANSTKVFVTNLKRNLRNRDLQALFSPYGNILSCVAFGPENEDTQYGIIRFEKEKEARRAIRKMNNLDVDGQKLTVVEHTMPDVKKRCSSVNDDHIFVANFSRHFDEKKLKELFREYGPVQDTKIITEEDGTSKGYAFVTFKNLEDADNCIEKLNGKIIDGRKLYVSKAMKKSHKYHKEDECEILDEENYVNLYINNLSTSIDDEMLSCLFSRFGKIISSKVIVYQSGISKGFGFVCYSNSKAASQAIIEMNGKVVASRKLCVSIAIKKDDGPSWA